MVFLLGISTFHWDHSSMGEKRCWDGIRDGNSFLLEFGYPPGNVDITRRSHHECRSFPERLSAWVFHIFSRWLQAMNINGLMDWWRTYTGSIQTAQREDVCPKKKGGFELQNWRFSWMVWWTRPAWRCQKHQQVSHWLDVVTRVTRIRAVFNPCERLQHSAVCNALHGLHGIETLDSVVISISA